ncbi:MAG: hypothetical protein M3O46_02190 [Myxococcota bacterium]|nr:hypothetical protein [Myxococcota bacterium]
MDLRRSGQLKVSIVLSVLAVGLSLSRSVRAEVSIIKTDAWELYTEGRVNAFFSYGFGDANPQEQPGEHIPLGGGLNTGNDDIPKIGPDGMPLPGQGTFQSMRLRSGFIPNVFAVGLRRTLSEDTTVSAYIAIWATIESSNQRKAVPVYADARQGYLKIASQRWGTLTAGRALDLFSRGATQNDFLYGHGYGLGYPGNIDDTGPTNGLIGFGVLAAFFTPGIMYETPSLGGFQLALGIYDPTLLVGAYGATREARPEAELMYDFASGPLKAHLFANGAFQNFYNVATNVSAAAYGAGYGGRIEVGPVHLGVAGHYGKGLGMNYAFEGGAVAVSQSLAFRWFDGYSAFAQVVANHFDFNAGWGISRTFPLDEDKMTGANISVPQQWAASAGVVYHATDYLHFDVDYVHAHTNWTLGERQVMNFINTGITVTW